MNIGVVCYHTIGGSGTVAYELGVSLARTGRHRLHFIGLDPPFRWSDDVAGMTFHRVELMDYPLFSNQPCGLALASRIAQVADDHDLDLVHAHYAVPHAVAAVLARDVARRRFSVVTTLHGTDINLVARHPSFSNISRFAIDRSDAVTAVSESLKAQTEELFAVPPGRVRVIPNFVATHRFDSVAPACCVDEARCVRPVLVHASNLRPVKRPLDLIEVARRLRERLGRAFSLWIVGDGPLRYEMEQQVRRLDLAGQVTFFGSAQKLEGIFACADVFLLASEQESFGLAALEAMACGTAVVAYRVGGLPEVVSEATGALVPPKDVEALTDAVLALVEDASRLEAARTAARERALEVFGDHAVVPLYERLFVDLAG